MLLQKRIGYGFNGYQVPETPRRTRSSRRWSAFKISNDDYRISSFDLLASVAGKVLLEGRNDPISSDKTSDIENQCVDIDNQCVDIENKCVDKHRTVKKSQDCLVKADNLDHGKKKIVVSELVQEAHQKRNCRKKSSSLSDNTHFGYTSGITSFDSSDRADPWDRVKWGHKYETGSCSYDSNKSNYDEILPMNNNNPSENAGKVSGHLFMKNEYPLFGSRNRMLISQKGVPQDCYRVIRDGGVNLDSRDGNGDDDENTACFIFGNLGKLFRSTPCIGGRRIRKILASKCTYQNNATAGNCDMNLKNGYHNKRLRQEKNYPIKKRRYLKCLSLSDNDDSTSCEDISGSTQKVIAAGDCNMNRGDSSSVAGESHVKLRIKSFKVPELSVEMPETATVGSLKRTVMEAVTAILGGGLDIGVLVQGKQIRDDSKTLIQTGISEDSHSDKLKFCLEPSSSSGSPEFLSPDNYDSSHPWYLSKSLTRHLATKGNSVESVHSAADTSATERTKALVPVPPLEAKAISVVPPGKLKRYEAAQRRTRRPFSVYEVEALVQAVEKLGTGRWRDVKMRAFEKSKHRTYVDLKDKWKTLVHTARISPQQRRGEPVPQALLDRVLAAHAYWTPKKGRFN